MMQGSRVLEHLWWNDSDPGHLSNWLSSLIGSFRGAKQKQTDAEKQPFGTEIGPTGNLSGLEKNTNMARVGNSA